MRYAMIVNSRVVDIVVSETLPNYPKTPDGKQVIAVKCGEEVKIGMYYNAVDNTFSIEFPEPEPTQLDLHGGPADEKSGRNPARRGGQRYGGNEETGVDRMKSGAEYFLDYYKGRFAKGEITEEQLSKMVTAGTISEDEKQYIMSCVVNREQEYLGYLIDLGVDTSEA